MQGSNLTALGTAYRRDDLSIWPKITTSEKKSIIKVSKRNNIPSGNAERLLQLQSVDLAPITKGPIEPFLEPF